MSEFVKLKSLELFAGIGGLCLGTAQAGIKPRFVIESDGYCCQTLISNREQKNEGMENWQIIERDVRKVDFGAIANKISVVTGGPPCQPFSIGGRHQAHDDAKNMFPEAIRAIRETAPRAFIFENVKGIARASFANYLEYIKLQLAFPEIRINADETWRSHLRRLEQQHTSGKQHGLEYRVLAKVINAADFGVPQRRERLFLVGFRSDLSANWSFPTPTHSRVALLWDQKCGTYWERHAHSAKPVFPKCPASVRELEANKPTEKPWVTLRDAICDLPDPIANQSAAKQLSGHEYRPGARIYKGHIGSPLDEPAKTLKAGVHGVPGGENMIRFEDGSVTVGPKENLQLRQDPANFLMNSVL